MSEDGSVYVGLDLGTSGLKAVACTAEGEVVARAAAVYPTQRPEVGAAEQETADWLAAMRDVLSDLASQVAPTTWRCLGLSAMIPTLVTADDGGHATGPAVTWEDARSEPQAEEFHQRVGDLYAVTGQRLDGRYLMPMLARLGRVDPERVRRSTWLLGAKDFLHWWLTGEPATDPSTAAGFGAHELVTGSWNESMSQALSSLLRGLAPRLPPVRPSVSRRTLRPELAAELGLPVELEVCLGAADSVAGAEGMGVLEPGTVAYVAGTSTVILGAADRPRLDHRRRYLVTPMARPDIWGLEMDLLTTGAALHWLAGLSGTSEGELVEAAYGRDALVAPTFLPFLGPGEQGALWDPHLSGTVLGLTLGHDVADVARGLITGVLVESRRCLAVLAETATTPGPVHVSGGGMASRGMAQELADASGRTVVWSPESHDHSALGAAGLAAAACGAAFGVGGSPGTSVTLVPDVSAAERWATLARRHDSLLATVTPGAAAGASDR
jgi:sugar (pentulose or hexulose) kinase